jgi:ribosomal protein S18 acetylase RimI-like enzyme
MKVIQSMDRAIDVMHSVGEWMEESGMKPSKWWLPQNLNKEFLSQYAKPEEFYVLESGERDAAAAIFQISQNGQDWKAVDKYNSPKALYIHWLCVAREFAGQNLPKEMLNFAKNLAIKNNVNLLRVDTNAKEVKLRKIYEDLGFELVGQEKEDYRVTAFYQRKAKDIL